MRQNLAIALLAIALLILATGTGRLGIGWVVLTPEGTSLLTIANALRLLAYTDAAPA